MEKRNIIFSTNSDWKPEETGKKPNSPLSGQTAYIQREKKHRGGKTVTVITDLRGNLKALQKQLQKHCGSGGTLKNNNIEIQGDHRDKIALYLQDMGVKVKLRGG